MPPSKRNELIDASIRVFSRHGFHASGLDSVLQEAGVSRMTLYNHFKSKDELIAAALSRRDEEFLADLDRFVSKCAKDPRGRILAIFEYFSRWFASREFHGCMFINASSEFPDAKGDIRDVIARNKLGLEMYLAALCEQLGARDPKGTAQELSVALNGMTVIALTIDRTPHAERHAPGAGEIGLRLAEMILEKAIDKEPSD